MKVLGLITARGGSKGIPGKNLVEVGGRSLLAWTAQAALASRGLTRTLLSTDDEAIRAAGLELGVDAPFLRPAELASDTARSIDAAIHALDFVEAEGQVYDALMVLQPTCPLRTASMIDAACGLLERSGADSVISFVPVGERHPARMKMLDDSGRVLDPPFAEAFEGQRRQDLSPLYLRDGAIYLTRTSVIRAGSFQGGDCRALVTDVQDWCNIDEPFDLEWAEFLLGRRAQTGGLQDA